MKTEKPYMRKIVLFDLDDTLYPELSFVKSGYKAVSEYLVKKYPLMEERPVKDGDSSSAAVYEKLYGLFKEDPRRVFNRLLFEYDIAYEEKDIKELVKLYREHKPSIELYPDALACLFKLKDMGCELGIISDGYHVSQKNKLEALFPGKMNLFGRVILTDELGREYYKPDCRSFIMMKEFFKTDWTDMIYVGDNPQKDFYIGNDYPILTVRLKKEGTVYENSDYLEGIREKLSIGGLSELPEFVKRS